VFERQFSIIRYKMQSDLSYLDAASVLDSHIDVCRAIRKYPRGHRGVWNMLLAETERAGCGGDMVFKNNPCGLLGFILSRSYSRMKLFRAIYRMSRALKIHQRQRLTRRLVPYHYRMRTVLWEWRRSAVERIYHYNNIDFAQELHTGAAYLYDMV
jgi:hypothetical protein